MNINVDGKAQNTYDAIVIGSGISGGWAAKELGEKGLKTLVLERGGTVDGFALCHTAPLVEGRGRDELRVLKLVCRAEADVDLLATQLADYARRSGTRRVAIRMQGAYSRLYAQLIRRGARVRWTDLRMTLADRPEPAHDGVILSNWEI